MSWLTRVVRPKLRALVEKNEIPDDLWHKCPKCDQMLYHRELVTNKNVCHYCDNHLRMGAEDRFRLLFDNEDYQLIDMPEVAEDPLKFKDSKRYVDRIKENRAKTGELDSVAGAIGKIDGETVVISAFNFQYMGGSLGLAAGEMFITAAEKAIELGVPYITIPSTGGARMQEGTLSLMQLPRTVVAVSRVKEAGLPYIVILADPTTGGVSASFAMLGDIAISEPGAMIGFAGRRVVEQTIREKLPDDFQTAEYLLEKGMLDMVVHRRDLRAQLGKLLKLINHPQLH